MAIYKRCNAGPPFTWSEMITHVSTDPNYPENRRAYDVSRLRKALQWNAAPTWHAAQSPIEKTSDFAGLPFNRQTIEQLFESVRPLELRISQKTVANTRSTCARIADHYGVPRGIGYTPLSEDCERLLSLVKSRWDRRALMPAMHYLSYRDISPWKLTQNIADDFSRDLVDVFRRADAKPTFVEFTRVWNKLTSIQDWPTSHLKRNIPPRHATIDWSEYPELETAIDRYLQCGRCNNVIDDIDLHGLSDCLIDPLEPLSIRYHKSSLRMVVWALRESGVPSGELTQLSSICRPERYAQAMKALIARSKGVVNRTIAARADALYRVARHPGVLTPDEMKSVTTIRKKISARVSSFLKNHADKDQDMLDQLDDPSVMDALLSLPTTIKMRVLAKKRPHTIGDAYAIQRALILELWLCAPYRIGAFASIALEQIVSMQMDTVEHVLLRGPKKQSGNKKSPEHFLNEATISLLKLYIEDYRPLIAAHNNSKESTALLPGTEGRGKHVSTLRAQMNKFVRHHTSLKNWHPHMIRKITPKIALDADPGALEVTRRIGGWADDTMLRKVYGQRVHRVSQEKYLQLLESRRLNSIRSLGARKRSLRKNDG